MKLSNFIAIIRKIKKENASLAEDEEKDIVTEARNWYSDRHESIVVQRNLLLVLTCVMLVTILLGVFMVGQVTLSKTVDPFVIEVEETSGITNVVNPISRKDLLTNEALQRYFIIKYLRAREGYSAIDYEYNYSTIVRLFSAPKVYQMFKRSLSDDRNPIALYGKQGEAVVKLRSVQFLGTGVAQVRFAVLEPKGVRRNKIATLDFKFMQMEMTSDERYVNPLGFQVTGYRVDDETL